MLAALRPRAQRHPRGVTIDELFLEPPGWPCVACPVVGTRRSLGRRCSLPSTASLQVVEPAFPEVELGESAIAKAVAFVDERLKDEMDGLGAIFPAMANAVMMYDALGLD